MNTELNDAAPSMQIVWHPTPEACQHAMWAPIAEAEGIPVEDLLEGELGGFDEEGNDVAPITMEQACEAIRDTGCWGFVNTNTNTIHAWADPEADPAMVVHMLAHEIGHATGTPFEDPHAEEMRAETFGQVAAQAVRLYAEQFGSLDEIDRLRARVAELEAKLPQELPAMTAEQACNAQHWTGMRGDVAWHLIERHADGWGDVCAMMHAWLDANRGTPEAAGGEPVAKDAP